MEYPPGSQEAADKLALDELEEAEAARADAEWAELDAVYQMPAADADDEIFRDRWIDDEEARLAGRRVPDSQRESNRSLRNVLRERLAVEEAYGPRPDLLAPAARLAARARARSAVIRIRGLS